MRKRKLNWETGNKGYDAETLRKVKALNAGIHKLIVLKNERKADGASVAVLARTQKAINYLMYLKQKTIKSASYLP